MTQEANQNDISRYIANQPVRDQSSTLIFSTYETSTNDHSNRTKNELLSLYALCMKTH